MTRHERNQPKVSVAALRPAADLVLNAVEHDPHTVSVRHLNLRGRYDALRVRHVYRLVTTRSPHRGVLRTGQKLNSP